MANGVRRFDGHLKLLDLDASALVDKVRQEGEEPPKEKEDDATATDQIFHLESYTFKGKEEMDNFETYYEKQKGTIIFSKIQPRRCRNHSYAVKTFMMDPGKTKDSRFLSG